MQSRSVRLHLLAAVLLAASAGALPAQDVTSGPTKGAKVPAIKVFDATGPHKDKDVDYSGDRGEKLTVYALIAAEKFDRPMNRFLKTLDGKVQGDFEGARVVAVWLTDDLDKTKGFLPRVQMSVQYEATSLTAFKGKDGPKDWGVNADAHLTVVVADKGKVVATFGYNSVNETDVKGVVEALKKAAKK